MVNELCVMAHVQDSSVIHKWVHRQGLSDATADALYKRGFRNLNDLSLLPTELVSDLEIPPSQQCVLRGALEQHRAFSRSPSSLSSSSSRVSASRSNSSGSDISRGSSGKSDGYRRGKSGKGLYKKSSTFQEEKTAKTVDALESVIARLDRAVVSVYGQNTDRQDKPRPRARTAPTSRQETEGSKSMGPNLAERIKLQRIMMGKDPMTAACQQRQSEVGGETPRPGSGDLVRASTIAVDCTTPRVSITTIQETNSVLRNNKHSHISNPSASSKGRRVTWSDTSRASLDSATSGYSTATGSPDVCRTLPDRVSHNPPMKSQGIPQMSQSFKNPVFQDRHQTIVTADIHTGTTHPGHAQGTGSDITRNQGELILAIDGLKHNKDTTLNYTNIDMKEGRSKLNESVGRLVQNDPTAESGHGNMDNGVELQDLTVHRV